MAVVTPCTLARSSETPSSLRLASRSASCRSRKSRARVWISLGGVLVEALDVGDLAGIDVGHLLHRLEALGGEQLGDHLVDVERLHEQLRALGELLLAPLRLLLLGEDVDVPAGELRGEPTFWPRRPMASESWLSGTTTSMRLESSSSTTLVTSAGASALTMKVAASGFHWMMSTFSPCSSPTTACTRCAAHADAGADRIDRGILGDDGDLGPGARIARHRLDLHDAVVDLGHLLRGTAAT